MRIPEIYREGHFGLSIEIFPPKSEQGDRVLWATLERLRGYAPAFVSCTYGAGGTTRTRTVEICRELHQRFELTTTAHFTCVGATREELVDWLHYAVENGITNIMALRGDAPQGQESFETPAGGLRYANELVELIRETVPEMGIGVAGYPEKHPEAPDADIDLANLKRKVDAGADAVFTQLFFENSNFFRFRDAYEAAGITVPLIPGIMPITEFARIKRITSLCGAVFPAELAARLEAVQDNAEAQFEIGVDYAITQCRELLDAGVPGMHFYVLNKSQACERILDSLGLASPVA
ncbi:methylenetetrahydrofolate reductase [NAD(P)H] [Maioricimonas sp. JC845]|uniref:methylenetetrahydrofolate reductase [NAD(P)H] n=1 Tax=Maioricimonas sp. JC845 TaxID=3232138 RepID=UPI00345A436B